MGETRHALFPRIAKIQAGNPMSNNKPNNSLLYNFAHVLLPVLTLESPQELYWNINAVSGEQYLIEIYQKLAANMDTEDEAIYKRLKLSKRTLLNDLELFLIRMPQPKTAPEAIFIAIAFRVEKQLPLKRVVSVRYFTLERGISLLDESIEYFFCEWAAERKHLNYGALSDGKEQTFLQAINQKLQETS